MNKIKKVLFTFVLLVLFSLNLDASIKEDTKYTKDTYIVGITKFNDVTIDSETLELAKENYNNFISGIDIDDVISIKYYSTLTNKWYTLDNDTFTKLDEEITNIDIFYVNNEEKIIEYKYSDVVDTNSISNEKVLYENNTFKVPATILSFSFKSNNSDIRVETKTNTTTKEKLYGEFYLPKTIKVLDENGSYLTTLITDVDDKIITDPIDGKYDKEGYKLVYTYESSIVDFTKEIGSELTIKQNYILTGSIVESDNVKFDKDTLTVTYSGKLKAGLPNNYIKLQLKAPEGVDTTNVSLKASENSIDEQLIFDAETKIATISLQIEELEDLTFDIKWSLDNTTTYKVVFKDAYLTKLVEYYTDDINETLLGSEDVIVNEPIKGYIKDGITVVKYRNGETLSYDTTTPVTNNMKLYVTYYTNPTAISSEELSLVKKIESSFTISLDPKDLAGKVAKITVNFDNENIVFDDNNYIKINEETNNTITYDEFAEESINLQVKLSDYEAENLIVTFEIEGKTYTSRVALNVEEPSFKIGEVYYATLKDAIDSITNNTEQTTITMLKNVTLTEQVEINSSANIKLDLGGFTLKGSSETLLKIVDNGNKLTIDNGTLENTNSNGIAINSTYNINATNSELTIGENAIIKSKYIGINLGGDKIALIVKGTIKIENDESVSYAIVAGTDTKVTLNGAIITSDGYALVGYAPDEVKIINSNIESNTGVYLSSSNLTITNSTIKVNGDVGELLTDTALNGIALLFANKSTVTIDDTSTITSDNNYAIVELYSASMDPISITGYERNEIESETDKYYFTKVVVPVE